MRIDQVARRLASEASRPVEIAYTGLRPGEKLHEVLFAEDEPDERPIHPLVSHAQVPPFHAAVARKVDPRQEPSDVCAMLAAACASADQRLIR